MENVEIVMNEVPALGEQTDAILAEFGFDSETIAGWRREKMI
jgi:crotonobetainyl-CoA:carnitine CoA-transferase CaiB-like acyl-CoA transferase